MAWLLFYIIAARRTLPQPKLEASRLPLFPSEQGFKNYRTVNMQGQKGPFTRFLVCVRNAKLAFFYSTEGVLGMHPACLYCTLSRDS
jgi:hypothetical protein